MFFSYPTFPRGIPALIAALLLYSAPLQANDECPANAGTMSTDVGPICLVNGAATLTGTPGGDAIVPDGFATLYVLTRTNGLIIEQVSATPSFTVNSEDVWRLHSLVYDPTTLDLSIVAFGSTNAYDVQGLLIQGGGGVCASLDISGAPVKTGACPCEAFAGEIKTDEGPICLVDGVATLTGEPGGNAIVPTGFSTLYVLTRTNGLIIEQVSATPSFTVNSVDVWRIHTLVYDPTTLDLSSVEFGVTNAYQVQGLLQQGGGSICASLDVNGAPTKTGICEQQCNADAGSISANLPDLCLVDGAAMLVATADGNANVPVGYQTVFVLTQGPGLVIVNAGASPAFTVNAPGAYTIHTLVFDPATLDLGIVELGVTTGFDVNGLLIQGGGSICASLDVAGAQFQVAQCEVPCTADAGSASPVDPEPCLMGGIAPLDVVPNGDAVVPAGYTTAYILARPDGIIENVEPITLFEWPLLGTYNIHTLVYDPFTLDPYNVALGSSNVSEFEAALIQGGGSICGSLDVAGVQFTVIQCAPPCDSDAGVGGDRIVCFTDPPVDLFSLLTGTPDFGGAWFGPDGLPSSGIFLPSSSVAGTYVYFVTDSPDCPGDTTQLVIDLIECGGEFAVNYDKETFGEGNSSATSLTELPAIVNLSLWPNPATDMVRVALSKAVSNSTRVDLIDAIGRIVIAPVSFEGTSLLIDVRSLTSGTWTVRINDGGSLLTGRFLRSDR